MPKSEENPDHREASGVEDTVLGNLIGYRMKRAYMQIQPEAQRVLAEDDLRVVSFSCLSIITDNPGIVQSELAEALQMERSNLVVVIDELEDRGLIARKKVPTDRRRYALTATLRGRRLRDRAALRVRQVEDAVVGCLDAEDRARLMAVLERLEARRAR
ncbi:MarR family transcriptional regulator [Pseudooceanicola sp. CBS1P-1]|uniref:MarR family transcriptional regulator n=1 Tax=Pseudooceanicola albus TaxID=2692189 RepID=A0A6L7G4M7_9RHOB|nr:MULTISPECIES: MarR family transcriptional regulator [Pseudooceanicola]MBT9385055.1 MarR family transcriptional regulator [Pseudooceanicola endophyticus]MXN18652.1 MarR family transcriptional regulator [Pseudooceanicola albus]